MKTLPLPVTALKKHLEDEDPGAIIAVFDGYGHYLYASPNHEHAIGYTGAELETMHLSEVVDVAEHHAAFVMRTIIVFYSKPINFSSRLVAKTGERVKVSGTLRHTRDNTGTMYFLTSVRVV